MSGRIFSSVGKKEIVAATGILWLVFLAAHLLGNLTIYFGAKYFNSYAEHLHGLGIILWAMEAGLLVTILLHAFTALWLFIENFFARPIRYAAGRKNQAGWVSKLMPYTGLYLFVFIVIHVVNFRLQRGTATDSLLAGDLFSSPAWVAYYAVSMIVVGLHVTHGLWSGAHTLGLGMTGRRNYETVRTASAAYSWVVGIGFGLLPIIILAIPSLLR